MQMQKFHQRRKSQRGITVMVKGSGIPLYGGGASLGSVNGKPVEPVPMNLQFTVRSRANVLGKLVKPKFYKSVDCSVLMDPTNMNKPISLKNKCTYRSSA
ncbi:Late embryogenesis abundant protein, LEA-14 [Cucumis melo var. makuwa]|uniref:Late embryogenesis abundant protein, LEA-14 n=1 Tax=Cucumis melo var. makuwa TaxID=1194695 RepID=A0A5D3CA33_CUCMM|nr:Late embryogenesis abundant protein, LEA-14 [Cucumis melo var. makuwa]